MKTTGAAPSRPILQSDEWLPSSEDLKHYPHFDAPLAISEVRALTSDPDRVAKNAFFPLIQYEKKWRPFRSANSNTSPPKVRLIRYASRRDAYIYARYRHILYPLYENALSERSIADVPIAYRKIPSENGKGKCNIDFANEVFEFIAASESCHVLTWDISSFFETLDHCQIEDIWKKLLNVSELPKDHAAVFRSITKYHWVDRTEVYRRLGFFGSKTAKNGTAIEGYLKSYEDIPTQLCSTSDFRDKICGEKIQPSLVQSNDKSFGIPQGTPISDLIANMYMIGFDEHISKLAQSWHGLARRYSDDIVLVLRDCDDAKALAIERDIRGIISSFGNQLVIKEAKSSIHAFMKSGSIVKFTHLKGAGKNGFEYLGFRFDGSRVFLRDSTLSNLRRKLTYSAKACAAEHRRRYPNRSYLELLSTFNFDAFFQRFLKVEDFDRSSSVRNWTFWTYARRSMDTFGSKSKGIAKQLKYVRPDGRRLVAEALFG